MANTIMSKNSIEYSIDYLFKIANPNRNIIFDIIISEDFSEAFICFKETNRQIKFNLVKKNAWYDLIRGNYKEIHWINNAKNTHKIPILFWVDEDLPFINLTNNEIIFNGDIISSSFFMLSRWEEKLATEKDEHERFRFIDSIAYKYDFITIPIVDEYAMLLRKYLQILFPNINLGKNEFHIKLSHDIDDIRRFESIKHSIKTFGGDLFRCKSLKLFIKSLIEYKNSMKYPEKDPYFLGIYNLSKFSIENNMDSAFYFKTSDKSNYDSGYIIEDYVRDCIFFLKEQGFEIGFHSGYYTFKNYDKFIEEKEILDKILGDTNYGGRQHYLRFDINTTWKYWEKAKLKYDSTVGYVEQEGFRCGVCHPFRPFDIDEDRELDIIEIPLIVMDATLRYYRNLTTEQGLNSILDLINKCKEVEGIFTLLWHNTAICRDWEEWFNEVYKEVLVL